MKRISFAVAVVFTLTVVFAIPSLAAVKHKPIPMLLEMFNDFYEMEEGYREKKWDEAVEVIDNIEANYSKLAEELKGKVDDKLIKKFNSVLLVLKAEIQRKDPERIEKPSMKLQEIFLNIMDSFDYPDPPALIIADKIIEEAEEGIEDKHYDSAAEEMEEILEFQHRISTAMMKKGASKEKILEFFEMAKSIEEMAEKKDEAAMKETLEKMDKILDSTLSK